MLDGIDFEILIWLLTGVLSGIGGLVTGTFFLVPVAAGAFVAAIVAALGGDTIWVMTVFFAVAIAVLAVVFRFAIRSKDEPAATREGAGRYIGAGGSVTVDIVSPGGGRVNIGTESWRAVSASGDPIEAGRDVEVVRIRGNALVVEPR